MPSRRTLLSIAWLILLPAAGPAQNSPQRSQDPRVQQEIAKAEQYQSDHKPAFAIDAYEKANRLAGGRCVPCLVQLADMYREAGDNVRSAKSAAQLETIVTSPQDKATAAMLDGTALLREGTARKKRALLAEADAQFKQAIRWQPERAQVLFLDGVALGRMGDDDDAKRCFLKYAASPSANAVIKARAERYLADPELMRETMAPAFSVRTRQGQVLSLDNQHGRVVLLDFWATWCGPCKADLPHLRNVVERFRGEPLVVLSISIDEDGAKWRSFVDQHDMSWPQYWDQDGQLASVFGVHEIPHYFTIDANGVLRRETVGSNAAIDGRLKKLLAQADGMKKAGSGEARGQ